MTNVYPITLPAMLGAVDRDLEERRARAGTFAAIRALGTTTVRVVRPAMRRVATRLAGAA